MSLSVRGVLNSWRFYTQDREAFDECLERKFCKNLDSLRMTNTVVAAVSVCFSFFPIFVERELIKGIVYLIVAVIAGIMSLYAKHIYTRHKAGARPKYSLLYTLITLYYTNLMSFGVYLDVWSDTEELAVMTMIFMVIALFLFVTPPIFNLILTFSAMTVFTISTVLLKESSLAIYDVIDILVAGIACTLFTWHVAKYKVQSELNAKSLSIALESAKQANESKSRFLATVSHEIRTPMNAIIGISDIELDCDNHPPETMDAFDRINSSGKTLLGIINDILDLSKVESKKLELLPVKYDTPSLINDTARLNVMRIGGKPIEFIIKVSESLPAYLVGDELRIKQILNNILSNAIKYTEQGSVTFEIDSKPDENGIMLVFTVRDTGQGMTKEQIAALYEEYTMFNREANRGMEGTGLGMSITKSLVEMMNGKIITESEPGIGSTFTVSLLQQSAGEGVLGKEVAEKLQGFKFTPGMQRAKVVREYMPYGSVLVVDDVDANVFVAKGLMKPYGLTVDTAESGYEALEKVRGGASYDVIFMDYMMPGMDGVETAKILREQGYTHPIIALSANAVSGMNEMFCDNGFDGFVSKPIDLRQLNYILNTFVRDKKPPEVVEEARRRKESGAMGAAGSSGSSGSSGSPASSASSASSASPVSSALIAADVVSAADVSAEHTDTLSLLRQIDSLDVESALEAMGDFEDVYLDTVKLTARLLPERIEKMDRFISTDNKSFTVEVHGLKSVLKNVGAAVLGNSAAQLERAAAENNQSYCAEHYPIFKTELLKLHDCLNRAITSSVTSPSATQSSATSPKATQSSATQSRAGADKLTLIQALAEARIAAEAFDRDTALEILSSYSIYTYDGETDELLHEITNALEVFDCEKALVGLIKLEVKSVGLYGSEDHIREP